jgi:hypothetical protein
MRLAVMQPYFLPYIGYFQLMAAVDKFVVFDDVNFINRGWINRNRILVGGEEAFATVPLSGASQNHKINEIAIAHDKPWQAKLLRTIEQSYKRAPYFEEVFPLMRTTVEAPATNLAAFVTQSLVSVKDWLGIACELVPSSAIYANTQLKGEARIVDICRQERATHYVNLPGGKDLYDKATFAAKGIALQFIQPQPVAYVQKAPAFVPWLSILDVMMCNGRRGTADMLKMVELQ